jgi:integrase/recombinase XerD
MEREMTNKVLSGNGRALSLETVRLLLAQPDSTTRKGIRDQTILSLMALHGLRVSEVARLDITDLDMEAGTMQVGNGSKRTIMLADQTRQVLQRWLAVRRLMKPNCPALFVTLHWTSAVVEPGGRIGTRGLRMMVDRYLKRVGAKARGISCDALRRSIVEAVMANPARFLDGALND